MISEAQKRLEDLFKSEHVKGKTCFKKKTGYWHVKLTTGERIKTKDLLTVQNKIDLLNGEEID